MSQNDLGRVADGEQALVNEAPAGLHPSGFDPSRNPTANEIVEALKAGNGIGFVRDMPAGTLVEPHELWIPDLACWVRMDGSFVSGDRGRGYTYFGPLDALLVETACTYWQWWNVSASGIAAAAAGETAGLDRRQEPDPQGDAQTPGSSS